MPRLDIRNLTPDMESHTTTAQVRPEPQAENTTIKGNASTKLKALGSSIFFHFIDAKGKSFGADIGRRLRFSEINILGFENSTFDSSVVVDDIVQQQQGAGGGDAVSVEVVFEMIVEKGMYIFPA
ncbi:hypothetical protein NP233_g9336 [Leucocoprinus birnbaumii]|uniref:Uncharacterized protein n=1 Tax=Leucocoprinus birnbaumii TaxID=56174 RepID=A0AAD5VKY2_9AGAR|nr:hypothetical protein NP233_g9336 [Leucocoprinus birnbaumii]